VLDIFAPPRDEYRRAGAGLGRRDARLRAGVTIAAVKATYLVTGGAGFIGSHLVDRLLAEGARVRVLDDFSAGSRANLAEALRHRGRLEVVRGDVRRLATVERATRGVEVVFHQAAMRSVPRS